MPCTMTRLLAVSKTAISGRHLDDLPGRFPAVVAGLDPGLPQDSAALLLVGPRESNHQRHPDIALAARLDHAPGDFVGAGDASEDVDHHAADPGVHEDDLERVAHRLRPGSAADVTEVGGLAPRPLDQVQRAHTEPGAVADHADVAVERDVGQVASLGFDLVWVTFEVSAVALFQVPMAGGCIL